ncbi:hypothetical protein QUB60_17320 [Microcoleus sp. A2-C5]
MQSSPFEMMEMARIVGGERGWVIRGLREYAWWGDRNSYNHRSVWYLL